MDTISKWSAQPEMESYHLNGLEISIDKLGADRFVKESYPLRYGRFSEIRTPEYIFQFNMNGEIRFIRGVGKNWPHPAEWLKRTDANDWVYYSVGGYNDMFHMLGEYYLPCLSYKSNSIWQYHPMDSAGVQAAFTAWDKLQSNVDTLAANGTPVKIKQFLAKTSFNDRAVLSKRTRRLHAIIGTRITVLPPDTRHVDYNVIPLMIAEGCLYHCDFCCIKTNKQFQPISKENILQQTEQLKAFYGNNLNNYNAVFLGNHDALAAGKELILMAADQAYTSFDLKKSYIKDPVLFLFGSVDSLLSGGNQLMQAINHLPYYTYINIGFESADAKTLKHLKKPLDPAKIKEAFQMMIDVNKRFDKVEITGNFILGENLSHNHTRSLLELMNSCLDRYSGKGAVYLSPLNRSKTRNKLLSQFVTIKNLSRLPVFLYLIQRL
jgi:hypothetical protein